MRTRTASLLILLGIVLLVVDQVLDSVLAFNQDVVQAVDLFFMVLALFLLAEGVLSLWRITRLGDERRSG